MSSSVTHPVQNHSIAAEPLGADDRGESMPYLGAAVPVGLVGAASVAVYILIIDFLAGHPLGTPNAMGGVLFQGKTFALDAAIRPGLVFGYSLLHGAAFIAAAAAAVSAEYTLSRRHVVLSIQLVGGFLGLFVGLQAVFVALAFLLGISWSTDLGLHRIVLGNAIAATSMTVAVYLRGVGRSPSRARSESR